jgi:hypothetical protein
MDDPNRGCGPFACVSGELQSRMGHDGDGIIFA